MYRLICILKVTKKKSNLCVFQRINNSKNGYDLSSARTSNRLQISIITRILCRKYDIDIAKYKLRNILRERGEVYYHIYKCICAYKGGLMSKDEEGFRAKLEVDRDRELLKDVDTQLFFKKLNLSVKKEPLRSIYKDKYFMEFIVYKQIYPFGVIFVYFMPI